MATEEGSSVIIDSLESVEISSTQTTRKNISSIHQYCRKPSEDEPVRDSQNRKLYYCSLCSYNASSTTNIRYHLQSKHTIESDRSIPRTKATAANQLRELWRQASTDNQSTELDSLILKSVLNKDIIDQALVNLVVVRNLPFRVVEWPEFHAFCQALNPESVSYITTAHSAISQSIQQSFQVQKDIVRKRLQSALTRIHLSVDIWTSPNNHLLLAVCSHFVDAQEKRTKALLALRTVVNHSGEEQWNTILPVLQDYGIVRRLGAVVADNSTTNDTLCRTISHYLLENEGIIWDPLQQRIRCQGHTINLIVQAFLFSPTQLESIELHEREDTLESQLSKQAQVEREDAFRTMGSLGKLHNIIVHSRSSASRTKEIESFAGRRIPLDNSTRWNSWYYMLSVALEKESAIDNYVKAYLKSLEKDYLSPQDWKSLRTISSFLQPFHRATLETQGDRVTLDQLLFTMDVLGKHMEKSSASHRTNKDITSRIQQAVRKFEEYYRKTDASPLYAAALILHPNRRTKYAKIWWKKDYQKAMLPKVKQLWIDYRDSAPLTNIVSYETPEITSPKELDEFDRIVSEINERTTRPASQDEYEDYCTEAPYEVQRSPLHWWYEDPQRKRWPRLSLFAIEILSIPAMSDEPERVFSGGRRTISWERMRIGTSSIEHSECMKSWHRSGVLIEDK
jgi:hAT family C-terminal dimerisation region